MTSGKRPTWDELVTRYPGLRTVATFARQAGDMGEETYDRWYGDIKPMLQETICDTGPDYEAAYYYLLKMYEGEA